MLNILTRIRTWCCRRLLESIAYARDVSDVDATLLIIQTEQTHLFFHRLRCSAASLESPHNSSGQEVNEAV